MGRAERGGVRRAARRASGRRLRQPRLDERRRGDGGAGRSGTGTLGGTAHGRRRRAAWRPSPTCRSPASPGRTRCSSPSTGLTPVTSTGITIGAGAATKLVMVTQPSTTAVNGVAFAVQPSVQLQDAASNPVATAGTPVTVAISRRARDPRRHRHGQHQRRGPGHLRGSLDHRCGGRTDAGVQQWVPGDSYLDHHHTQCRRGDPDCDQRRQRPERHGQYRGRHAALGRGAGRERQPRGRRLGDLCRGDRRRERPPCHGGRHQRVRCGRADLVDHGYGGAGKHHDGDVRPAERQPGHLHRHRHCRRRPRSSSSRPSPLPRR